MRWPARKEGAPWESEGSVRSGQSPAEVREETNYTVHRCVLKRSFLEGMESQLEGARVEGTRRPAGLQKSS